MPAACKALSRLLATLVPAALIGACAATPSSSAPAAGPDANAEMTLEQARTLIAEIESGWQSRPDPSLAEPTSIEDVVQILKRDQVTLFPAGVRFLADRTDSESVALHGQIELAWGEAYAVVMQILHVLHQGFDAERRRIELQGASGTLGDADRMRLKKLRLTLAQMAQQVDAFQLLAEEHIAEGSRKAQECIKQAPDSYVGYRVAADYYRMTGDWKAFADMVQKIEQTNPDSNGLVFLKGTAAVSAQQDPQSAQKHFRQALTRDAQFVRAQAHLVLAQRRVAEMYAEFKKLKQLNPDHQLVHVAGDSIEKAYSQWQEAQEQSQQVLDSIIEDADGQS